ncbi:MAG: hypothetical protein IPH12_21560 [Saprospirales bacterium]|nr:hypothetical protein [Saprospirales bacterium]
MTNRSTYLIIVLAIVALAAFFYWRSFSGRKKYEWRDSWVQHAYSEQSDQPYGTQILHRLLQGYFPGQAFSDMRKSLPAELPPDSLKPASYVFVGEALFLDSLSTAHLLAFVKAGNTAFLSSKTIPFDLMFHLYFDECDQAEWNDYEMREDTLVSATVGRPALDAPVPLRYARQNQTHAYRWAYIEPYFFCDSLPPRPLGYLNDSMVNFAGFPYGKGRVLLHTTPIAFSNYHLLKQEGRAYTERVLSYLPEGNIYWDACSRVPETVARRRNQSRGFSRQLPPEHPLKHPSTSGLGLVLVPLGGACRRLPGFPGQTPATHYSGLAEKRKLLLRVYKYHCRTAFPGKKLSKLVRAKHAPVFGPDTRAVRHGGAVGSRNFKTPGGRPFYRTAGVGIGSAPCPDSRYFCAVRRFGPI